MYIHYKSITGYSQFFSKFPMVPSNNDFNDLKKMNSGRHCSEYEPIWIGKKCLPKDKERGQNRRSIRKCPTDLSQRNIMEWKDGSFAPTVEMRRNRFIIYIICSTNKENINSMEHRSLWNFGKFSSIKLWN